MSKLYWMNQVIASDNAEYIEFIPGSNTGLVSTKTGPAIREVAVKAKGSQSDISALQVRTSTIETNVANVTNRVGTLENEFTANGTRLYMDYKNGKYGYNLSANRGADTFFPFSLPPTMVTLTSGTWYFNHDDEPPVQPIIYTTTKKYRYIYVFFHARTYMNVWAEAVGGGTLIYNYVYYYGVHTLQMFQDVPAGTYLQGHSSGSAEDKADIGGIVWGIED